EVAASAAELGVKTSVVEIAPRILARVCNGEISALIHERHRARGVDIRVGTAVSALREMPDGRVAVDTGTGDPVAADLIGVGTGGAPADRLAKAAGLATQDGIIVDDHARTCDAAIFAAGDCTRFPGPHGPVRLENWRHAQEHGAIAGRNAAGGDVVYEGAPSFWSEQYDMYIQGVGWPVAHPSARVRRPLDAGAVLMFELDGARLAHALGINAQRDMAMARRLIERGVPVDASELADAAKPLAAMLREKVCCLSPGMTRTIYGAQRTPMATGKKERVGIVGVGRMGLAMLKHLVKHGYQVTACDIDDKQLAKARDAGAATAKTPA